MLYYSQPNVRYVYIYICVSRNKATAEPFLPSFLPSLFSLYFIHYVITLNANTLKNALALFA